MHSFFPFLFCGQQPKRDSNRRDYIQSWQQCSNVQRADTEVLCWPFKLSLLSRDIQWSPQLYLVTIISGPCDSTKGTRRQLVLFINISNVPLRAVAHIVISGCNCIGRVLALNFVNANSFWWSLHPLESIRGNIVTDYFFLLLWC